jgi:hypothetical protein
VAQGALQIVTKAFPNKQVENWTRCGVLYHHAQLLLRYAISLLAYDM